MQDGIKKRNEKLAQKTIQAFEKRHFNAFFCETKEQAIHICNKWYENPSRYYADIIKIFG